MTHLTTQGVHQVIKRHVADKEPFSLVRLGDGEARLIGYPQHVRAKELDASLTYWYGEMKPSLDQAMQLRGELMTAVENADVVGLPNAHQEAKNRNYKLATFLVQRHRLLRGDTTHCGIHRHLLEEGLLYDILNGLPSLSVITCRDVVHALQDSLSITAVRWHAVPEEANTGAPKSAHYPDRHYELLRELDVGPGELFLVGAGPNGKVYCDAVKRDGGIALDLGSVFDGWNSVISRSYIRQNPELYRL